MRLVAKMPHSVVLVGYVEQHVLEAYTLTGQERPVKAKLVDFLPHSLNNRLWQEHGMLALNSVIEALIHVVHMLKDSFDMLFVWLAGSMVPGPQAEQEGEQMPILGAFAV